MLEQTPLWLFFLIWLGLTIVVLKRYAIKPKTWFTCWGVTAFLFSCAGVPRQNYLECNLSNGDQFKLIDNYKWNPLVRLIPVPHPPSNDNDRGIYKVYFKPKGWWWPVDLEETEDIRYDLEDIQMRKEICSNYFILGNQTQSTRGQIINVDGDKIIKEDMPYPPHKLIDATFDEAIKLGLYSTYYPEGFNIKSDRSIVYEYALTKDRTFKVPNIVDAVIVVKSTDNGRTWSTPIIRTEAKLFIIGKSVYDQPIVAKPGKWKIGPH